MSTPRSLPPLLLVLSLLAALSMPATAAPSGRSDDYVGIDGATWPSAPVQVAGRRGQVFTGIDLDLACRYGGQGLSSSMRSLTKLAKVITASGRRVVWTAAPSKTAVLGRDVDPALLPHGSCDLEGLAQQRTVLDRLADPAYLTVRRLLAQDERQTYYKTDIHWTTVGASVFTRALARELEPRLARLQRYTYTTDFDLGAVSAAQGTPLVPENAPAAVPAGPVRVSTAKGSTPWANTSQFTFDHAWDTRPAKRTWPGRTLLLGDSFMLQALSTARPIFRHGRFLWVEHVPLETVLKQVEKADTVVIEVLQPFITLGQIVTSQAFVHEVRRTLKGPRPR